MFIITKLYREVSFSSIFLDVIFFQKVLGFLFFLMFMILITAATIIVTITSIIRMSDFSEVAVSVYKIYYNFYITGASLVAQRVKNLPTMQEM